MTLPGAPVVSVRRRSDHDTGPSSSFRPALAAGLAPWLAALAGAALSLWLFYPGYLSWDSAYQWWQVRSGE